VSDRRSGRPVGAEQEDQPGQSGLGGDLELPLGIGELWSIAAVAEQVGATPLPDPITLAPSLRTVLGGVVDPRRRRGVRHGLVVVPTPTVCAVAAGAQSFVAVAEWVADLPTEVATALGVDVRCPSESTIRRLISRVDPDRFDAVIGRFLQCLRAQAGTGAITGRRRVLAVDGRTLRVRHEVACIEWITLWRPQW
jgi:hypothetical protein